MSKAFDTVNRNRLFEGLEEIMLPEELHIKHILINDVKIKVRVGSEYGLEFDNNRNYAGRLPQRHPVHLLPGTCPR